MVCGGTASGSVAALAAFDARGAAQRRDGTGEPHIVLERIADREWLELNCAVVENANPLPELLPDVPRDAVRQIFTARGGRVDFGCGWVQARSCC